jgi:regulator of sigma E protease
MALMFVLVLVPLVVIHEFGHFIVAKWCGIRVDIFSVGFGKRLFGFKKGDTDYRVSLIPLGGYVKMAGESLDDQRTGAPDEFMSKTKMQRFYVAVAGPAMNILLALMIPAAIAMVHLEEPAFKSQPAVVQGIDPESPAAQAGLKTDDVILKIGDEENPTWSDVDDYVIVRPGESAPMTIKRGDEIKQVSLPIATNTIDGDKIGYGGFIHNGSLIATSILDGRPAAQAGLQENDQILAINGKPLEQSENGQLELIAAINGSNGQAVKLKVERNGSVVDLTPTPEMSDGRYRIGFVPAVRYDMTTRRLSLFQAIPYSFNQNWRMVKLTATAIGKIFEGRRKVSETFTGPLGIAKLSNQAAKAGTSVVLDLMALLSLNLGVFNLFPIPVLDGGLIFMLALEGLLGLFGWTLSLRVKEKMIQAGFVALMLLMGFVIYNDIAKNFTSSKPPAVQQQQPVEPQKTDGK